MPTNNPLIDSEDSGNEGQERAAKRQKGEGSSAISNIEQKISSLDKATESPLNIVPPPVSTTALESEDEETPLKKQKTEASVVAAAQTNAIGPQPLDPKAAALAALKARKNQPIKSDSDESSDDEVDAALNKLRAQAQQQKEQKKSVDLKRKTPESAVQKPKAIAVSVSAIKKEEPKRKIPKKPNAQQAAVVEKPKVIITGDKPAESKSVALISAAQKTTKTRPAFRTSPWISSQYNGDETKTKKYSNDLIEAYKTYTGAGAFVVDDKHSLFCVLIPKLSKKVIKEEMADIQRKKLIASTDRTEFKYKLLLRFKFIQEFNSSNGTYLLFKIEIDNNALKQHLNITKKGVLDEFIHWKNQVITALKTGQSSKEFGFKNIYKTTELYLARALQLEEKATDDFKQQLKNAATPFEGSKHALRHFGSFISPLATQENNSTLYSVSSSYLRSNDSTQENFVKRIQTLLKKEQTTQSEEVEFTKTGEIEIDGMDYMLITAKASPQRLRAFIQWKELHMHEWETKNTPSENEQANTADSLLLQQLKTSDHKNPELALSELKTSLKKAYELYANTSQNNEPDKLHSLLRFVYVPELKKSLGLIRTIANNFAKNLTHFVTTEHSCDVTIKTLPNPLSINAEEYFILSIEGNEEEQLKFAALVKKTIAQNKKKHKPEKTGTTHIKPLNDPGEKFKKDKIRYNKWIANKFDNDLPRTDTYISQLKNDHDCYDGAGSFVADSADELFCVLRPKRTNISQEQRIKKLSEELQKTSFKYKSIFDVLYRQDLSTTQYTGTIHFQLFEIVLDEEKLKKDFPDKNKSEILKEFKTWKQEQIKALESGEETNSFKSKNAHDKAEIFLEHTLKLKEKSKDNYKAQLAQTAAEYDGCDHPNRHFGFFAVPPGASQPTTLCAAIKNNFFKGKEARENFIVRLQQSSKSLGYNDITFKQISNIEINDKSYLLVTAEGSTENINHFLNERKKSESRWKQKKLKKDIAMSGYDAVLDFYKGNAERANDFCYDLNSLYKSNRWQKDTLDFLKQLKFDPDAKFLAVLISPKTDKGFNQWQQQINSFAIKAEKRLHIKFSEDSSPLQILIFEGHEDELQKFYDHIQKKLKAPTDTAEAFLAQQRNIAAAKNPDITIESIKLALKKNFDAYKTYAVSHLFIALGRFYFLPECNMCLAIGPQKKVGELQNQMSSLIDQHQKEHRTSNIKVISFKGSVKIDGKYYYLVATKGSDKEQAAFGKWLEDKIHQSNIKKEKIQSSGMHYLVSTLKDEKNASDFASKLKMAFNKSGATWGKFLELPLAAGEKEEKSEQVTFVAITADKHLRDARAHCKQVLAKKSTDTEIKFNQFTNDSPLHIDIENEAYCLISCTVPKKFRGSIKMLIDNDIAATKLGSVSLGIEKLKKQCKSANSIYKILLNLHNAFTEENNFYPVTFDLTEQHCYVLSTKDAWNNFEKAFLAQIADFKFKDSVQKLDQYTAITIHGDRFRLCVVDFKDLNSVTKENLSEQLWIFLKRKYSTAKNNKQVVLLKKTKNLKKEPLMQLGWNCFDIAAELKRDDLVKYALEKSTSKETRAMLAPEIKQAAAITTLLMNLQEEKQGTNEELNKQIIELFQLADAFEEKEDQEQAIEAATKLLQKLSNDDATDLLHHALPKSMHSIEIKNLVNAYNQAHEKMKPAIAVCNDKLGNPEGKRLSLAELDAFFAIPYNQQKHANSYEIFKAGREQFFDKHEKALESYCNEEETYKQYIKDYYGKEQWFAFQKDFNGGHTSTSMVDIAAEMLKVQIVIYEKNKIAYRTKKFGNKEIQIDYDGHSHFTKRKRPEQIKARQATAIRKSATAYAKKLVRKNKPLPKSDSKKISKKRTKFPSPEIFDVVFYEALSKAYLKAQQEAKNKEKFFAAENAEALLFSGTLPSKSVAKDSDPDEESSSANFMHDDEESISPKKPLSPSVKALATLTASRSTTQSAAEKMEVDHDSPDFTDSTAAAASPSAPAATAPIPESTKVKPTSAAHALLKLMAASAPLDDADFLLAQAQKKSAAEKPSLPEQSASLKHPTSFTAAHASLAAVSTIASTSTEEDDDDFLLTLAKGSTTKERSSSPSRFGLVKTMFFNPSVVTEQQSSAPQPAGNAPDNNKAEITKPHGP